MLVEVLKNMLVKLPSTLIGAHTIFFLIILNLCVSFCSFISPYIFNYEVCIYLIVYMWLTDLFAVELLLYAPKRPVVDFSVAFLWMMVVGTILCASCWSQLTAPQQADERYNELSPKVSPSTIYSFPFFLTGKIRLY